MIYDILEVFKKEYEQKGDKLILDNYQLKDGLYVRVNENGGLDYFKKSSRKIKIDGKSQTEHDFKDANGNNQQKILEWFKERDYYSNVIDTSKSYDAPKKTIHNNNYLTLFMKIEEFLNVEFAYIENKLFGKILSFKTFDSKNEKKIVQNYCHIIKPLRRKKDIVKKLRILKQKFDDIKIVAKEYSPKEYIRIFFDKDIDVYKSESSIYLALKIYNDNKYSIEADSVVYGLSSFNMGLNSKKPYLEHKTKKLTTPIMITSEFALETKIFFDWLGLQKYKTDLLANMFLNRYSDNGKPIINDFDYIPHKIEKLKEPITVKNYLHIKDKSDFEISELWQLENTVDETFYNKQLKFNYFNDDLKVSQYVSKNLQTLIFETKYAMVNYFKKYDNREFYQVVEKYGTHFVMEHLRQRDEKKYYFAELKAKESLNLKFSLLQHKGEKVMDIKNMEEKIMKKLETSNYESLNSEEFFYLCGQVASYLLSKKNQHEKMHDLVEPFLRANNAKKLKKEIEFAFFQYKHAIHFGAKRINNAIALIGAYEGEEKLSFFMDSFLVGYLSNTYIFKSKEEN